MTRPWFSSIFLSWLEFGRRQRLLPEGWKKGNLELAHFASSQMSIRRASVDGAHCSPKTLYQRSRVILDDPVSLLFSLVGGCYNGLVFFGMLKSSGLGCEGMWDKDRTIKAIQGGVEERPIVAHGLNGTVSNSVWQIFSFLGTVLVLSWPSSGRDGNDKRRKET